MKKFTFTSTNKGDYQEQIHNLRRYFALVDDTDILDASKAGNAKDTPFQLAKKKPFPKPGEKKEELITSLFQHPQHAFFAHEIIKKLKEVEPAADSRQINVIYELDNNYGKSATIQEDDAGKRDPQGSFDLKCSLKNYTSPISVKKLKKGKVQLTLSPPTASRINKVPNSPDKNSSPSLSAIVCTLPTGSPTNRNGAGAAIFLGHIPTIEMSSCVPYIEVSLVTSQPPLTDDNRVNGMGISRFLFGSSKLSKDSEINFVNALDARVKPNHIKTSSAKSQTNVVGKAELQAQSRLSILGMEGFTSPQTMVNAEENFDDAGPTSLQRTASVIDKFRPFLSLRDFKIEVVANVGLIQQKTATMQITLHDRSRLGEVAELVKIDLYSDTSVAVEYGWSHPAGISGNNEFGKFLNSLKTTERYQVVTTNFSFDEVGQVNIMMRLGLLGQADAGMLRVGDNEFGISGTAAIAELEKAMSHFKKLYPNFGSPEATKVNVEPRGGAPATESLYKFNLNEISDARSLLGLDEEKREQIREFVKTNKASAGDAGKLAKILSKVFSQKTANANNLEQIRKSIRTSVQAKLDAIMYHKIITIKECVGGDANKNNVATFDKAALKKAQTVKNFAALPTPTAHGLFDPFHHKIDSAALKTMSVNKYLKETNFGTLFMSFVARPLALSGRFDEVQVVFYTFNKEASFMRNIPISSFPIALDSFTDKYTAFTSLGASLNLYEFLGFVNAEYVGNVAYKAYGFSTLYTYNDKDKKYETIEKYQKNTDLFHNDRNKILAHAYGQEDLYNEYVKAAAGDKNETKFNSLPKFVFKQPRLTAQFEMLPHHSEGLDKTILRIHVFDATSSNNSLYEEAMKSSTSDSFSSITSNFSRKVKDAGSEGRVKVYKRQLRTLLSNGIIKIKGKPEKKTLDDADFKKSAQIKFVVAAGPAAVKRACMQEMPAITYGSATTNIITANVSSNAVGGLFEINVLRSNLGHGRTPLGARDANLPVELAPITLSITCMGFPFFFIGQEFFIDFNTGTTVDNIYIVMQISHNLSEGQFNTQLKLVPRYAYGQSKSVATMIADAVETLESSSATK